MPASFHHMASFHTHLETLATLEVPTFLKAVDKWSKHKGVVGESALGWKGKFPDIRKEKESIESSSAEKTTGPTGSWENLLCVVVDKLLSWAVTQDTLAETLCRLIKHYLNFDVCVKEV